MRLYHVPAALIAIPLALPLVSCGGGGAPARAARNASLTVASSLVAATNDFGFRLYRRLATTDGGSNLFVSPPSIELALAMTYNGAGGSTAAGMAAALGLNGMSLDELNAGNGQLLALLTNPDPKVDLFVADALWTQNGLTLDTGFLQRNRQFYGATVQGVNFRDPATADRINHWASDHTLGTIKEIVTPLDIQDDIIELTNAVYFRGPWTDPFDPANTRDGTFTKLDGTTKTLPMMARVGSIDYQENDLFQGVRLPYGGRYLSMCVLLPKPGKTLGDVAAQLTPQNWSQWKAGFQSQELLLRMPRFKADYSSGLKECLSAMGMTEAFDRDHADFRGIFAPGTLLPGNVFLTHVFHKTHLSVDEKGTTAAATTVIGGGTTSMPPSMLVDRPFFVVIADEPTGVVLFLGSIADPQ